MRTQTDPVCYNKTRKRGTEIDEKEKEATINSVPIAHERAPNLKIEI